MPDRPQHDDTALTDAWGCSRAPVGLTREARVRLLGEAAHALLEGRLPSDECRLFLAGGLASWLDQGGDLLGEYWRVKPRRGSHLTPPAVWSRLHRDHRDERQDAEDAVKSAPSSTSEE